MFGWPGPLTHRQHEAWIWFLRYTNGYKDPPREFPGGPPHVTAENKAAMERKLAMVERRRQIRERG